MTIQPGPFLDAYHAGGAGLRIKWDRNGDGDFADAGEDVQVPSATGNACDVAGRPGQPLAVATVDTSSDVELRIDEDGDGVFDSTRDFADTTASPAAAVAVTDLGTVLVAAQGRLHFAP